MKKNYVMPTVEAVEVEIESLMTAVSGETGGAGTGDGTSGNDDPDLAGGRRGSWGNFWD